MSDSLPTDANLPVSSYQKNGSPSFSHEEKDDLLSSGAEANAPRRQKNRPLARHLSLEDSFSDDSKAEDHGSRWHRVKTRAVVFGLCMVAAVLLLSATTNLHSEPGRFKGDHEEDPNIAETCSADDPIMALKKSSTGE